MTNPGTDPDDGPDDGLDAYDAYAVVLDRARRRVALAAFLGLLGIFGAVTFLIGYTTAAYQVAHVLEETRK